MPEIEEKPVLVRSEEGVTVMWPHITVADEMIDNWTQEVSRLSPKKAAKWKGKSASPSGNWQQVRYRPDGVSVNGCVTNFETKVDRARAASMCCPHFEWLPTISFTQRAQLYEEKPLTHIDVERGIVDGALPSTVEEFNEDVQDFMAQNMTFNHRPHKNYVRVRTAAGEPCRS